MLHLPLLAPQALYLGVQVRSVQSDSKNVSMHGLTACPSSALKFALGPSRPDQHLCTGFPIHV